GPRMPRRFPSPSRWRQRERKTSSSATSLAVASQVSDISATSLAAPKRPFQRGKVRHRCGHGGAGMAGLGFFGADEWNCKTTDDVPCWGRSVEIVNREPDMNTRRDFLKRAGAATGIVFCSCGLLDAASAQQGGGQRLPVMVNGKRVKTIDVHAHCHFREAV